MASNNNITSAFVDLATYDEAEKFMYGGATAITYFSRCIKKASWFSQIPVILRQENAIDFGAQHAAAKVSRQGDVLLQTWFRFTTPTITATAGVGNTVAWIEDLGHAMCDEITLTFNDIVAQRLDNHWLNFWTNFTTPESKAVGYWDNMISNGTITVPAAAQNPVVINVPLPFFFSRDSGVGLPVASLPYNDIKINFNLLPAAQLIVQGGASNIDMTAVHMTNPQVWANYAVVTNQERVKMGRAPRDMLIEQMQRTQTPITNLAATDTRLDIRFSYSIKALFWAAQNLAAIGVVAGVQQISNYTTHPTSSTGAGGVDPIDITSILYENTLRLDRMGSDYFSLVDPWYHWIRIPTRTGYHAYSYSLNPYSIDPQGSTNYSKLNVVTIVTQPSAAAVAGAGTYRLIVRGLNNNIVRISGGSFGFPTM
jgi:hypothetical protein